MLINIDYLRRLRRQHRLSLLAVGEIIGRNRATVWRYENGQLEMPVSVLFRLADYYKVPVDSLRWQDPTERLSQVQVCGSNGEAAK